MGRGEQLYRLRLWGEVAVDPAHGPLSRRARALLARLALAQDLSLDRHAVAVSLWPDRTDAQAFGNLRQLLHDHGWLWRGEAPLLLVSRDRLALDPPLLATDEDALLAADVPPAQLAAALDRTDPHFLADLDGVGEAMETWRKDEARRAMERLTLAVRDAAGRALAEGDGAAAARLADAWTRFDPCDEAVARLGFAGDAAAHDTAALERRMAALRERLAQDLDADPAAATIAAYLAAAEQMGQPAGAPAAEALPPLPAPPRPAARRRMRVAAIAAALFASAGALWWQSNASAPVIASAEQQRATQLAAAARKLNATRTRAAFAEAPDLARAAVARDPRNAPALAELALAIWSPAWMREQQDPGAGQRIRAEALDYLDRALSITPGLPRAMAIKGVILGDDQGARLIERAVAADPADADLWYWAARARQKRGDYQAALTAYGEAAAIDPTSRRLTGVYLQLALQMGRPDLARVAVDRYAKAAGPGAARQFEGSFALIEGRLADATAAALAILRDGGTDAWLPGSILINLAHAVGDDEAARALAARLPSFGKGYAPVLDPSGATARTRAAGPKLLDRMLVEVELRSLLRAGQYRLVVDAARPAAPGAKRWEPGDDDDPILMGAPLVLALERDGRQAEAAILRGELNAYAAKAGREGLANYAYRIGLMRLACLDGDGARAADALAAAIAGGWRGQFAVTDVDPADDPVCANVASDPRFAAQRARLAKLIAAERPAVRREVAAAIAWLDANPLPAPKSPPR